LAILAQLIVKIKINVSSLVTKRQGAGKMRGSERKLGKVKETFSIAVKGCLPKIRIRLPEASRTNSINIIEQSINLCIDK